MATDTFADNLTLSALFDRALSPIATSGQNLVALAMHKRQQADLEAQDIRREAADLAKARAIEGIRQEGENARAVAANAAVLARMREEYKMRSSEEKDKERRSMIEKANEYGAKLPQDTSFDTASQAFIDAHGKSFIEASKNMGSALNRVISYTGANPQVLASRIANLVADDPGVAKALTVDEREAIRANPTKLNEFRAKFAANKPWWGKNDKYEAFNTAVQAASTSVQDQLEKEASSKPEGIRAAADLKQASQQMESLRKVAGLSPEVESTAFDVYSKASSPQPQAQGPVAGPPQAPGAIAPLPPRAGAVIPGTPFVAPAAPPLVGQNVLPNIGGTVPMPMAANSPFQTIPWSVPATARIPLAPTAPASSPFLQANPGGPIDPSVLSTLRLQRFLQDQAASQNALTPTAFPATAP